MNNPKKTSWQFHTDNKTSWKSMLEACENAKKTIDLEQFIFITDDIGKKFIDVCVKKASQGVRVRFLWDAAGSFSFFGSTIVEELESKGIELVFFKTLFPSFFKVHKYKSWYFRNHKRTLVIDSKIGFTGSICISDAMKDWRDTVVRLEGPVVEDMQEEFERMWRRANRKKAISAKNAPHDQEFKYIANYPLPKKHTLNREVIKAIKASEKYIYITTPYFVPTRHLFRVLKSSAKRGVEIRLIVPEWSDHPLVDLCCRSFFSSMLKLGIKIYLYRGAFIHNKTVVVDGNWSTIGTLNMDSVSLLYNFEANIISTNKEFAQELVSHFEQDLVSTEEITFDKWKSRYFIEKFSSFFARMIRDFL